MADQTATLSAEDLPSDNAHLAVAADVPEYDLTYRDVFWRGRDYEDLCDRAAIRALLPREGGRLIEIGAGFGRLVDEYAGYREVVLLDSSPALLEAGRDRLAGDPRLTFVLGDAHTLPFPGQSFDAIVCVRVIHHFGAAGPIFDEFARVLRPGGVLVLEFANKQHLKAVIRYAARRQASSPFGPEPFEYRALHFDHSPGEIRRLLKDSGFRIGPTRTASLFRLGALKSRVPARVLAGIERPLQAPLGRLALGPSMYLRARRARP